MPRPVLHVLHTAAGEPSVLSAAQVRRLSAGATDRSIIIFRNQLTSLPATGGTAGPRVRAARASQAAVLSELALVHAAHVTSYHIINAVSATISAAEASRLRANPAVRAVVPDAFRHLAPLGAGPGPAAVRTTGRPAAVRTTGRPAAVRTTGRPAGAVNAPSSGPQPICPANPAQPIVEPEARTVLNADAAEQIATGTGVKVGIIADGIDPDNPDLIRPDGPHVIFDYQDFSGFGPAAPTDGREAFLDAGRSPRRPTRPTTCPASSTRRTRCRRAATSRSRGSPPARAWPC
jgi:hypothetical protein